MTDKRYKFPQETRVVGGKRYKYLEWRKTKAEAESVAERQRSKGKLVRIAKVLGGYGIYVR